MLDARPVESRRRRYLLREHADAIALVAITAIAAAVRFSTLGVQSLDHDEAVTALRVLQPTLGGTLHVVTHLERSPPLYYIVAWIWAKPLGAGTGAVDLRALSALIGTLTVPLAFLAGRELASRRAGVVGGTLVALNPYLVWYSQEIRSYGLMVLLSTLGLYLFARALRRPSPAAIALWAVASAFALCSHYFAAFTILPEAVWLLVATRPRRWALGGVGATAVAGLALLPLAITQEGSGRVNQFSGIPVAQRAVDALVHFASTGGAPGGVRVAVGAGEALLAVAAVLLIRRYATDVERRGALITASVGLAAFAVPLLLAFGGVDYVDPRNMIGVLVPLLVTVGIACGAERAGGRGIAIAVVVAAAFAAVLVAVNLTPAMQRTDYRGAARAIGQSPKPRAIVVPRLALVPIAYYLHHARPLRLGGPPVAVRSLDVLGTGPPAASAPKGFELVFAGGAGDDFQLSLYRSPRPVRVEAKSLQAQNLIGEPSRALLTGAAPGR